jgi:hypothetical protein
MNDISEFSREQLEQITARHCLASLSLRVMQETDKAKFDQFTEKVNSKDFLDQASSTDRGVRKPCAEWFAEQLDIKGDDADATMLAWGYLQSKCTAMADQDIVSVWSHYLLASVTQGEPQMEHIRQATRILFPIDRTKPSMN